MDKDNRLGTRLKELRETHGYSQQQVADYLHIIRQTYSHYETGRIMPPVKNIYSLARFYNIEPRALIEADTDDIFPADDTGLTSQEVYLLYYFRRLEEKDKEALLLFAEIKCGEHRNGEK